MQEGIRRGGSSGGLMVGAVFSGVLLSKGAGWRVAQAYTSTAEQSQRRLHWLESAAAEETAEQALPTAAVLQLFHFSTLRLVARVVRLAATAVPLVLGLPLLAVWPGQWYALLATYLKHQGPCFIKFGQWLSTRRDVLPDGLCDELHALTHRAALHAEKATRIALRRAYGDPDQEFSEFDVVPLASGAISQVYRARLRADGQEVVVKVRHPGVERQVAMDLQILRGVVGLLQSFSGLGWLNLAANIRVFERSMRNQCDLRVEAANLDRFAHNFGGSSCVRFPRPVHRLCRDDVLVESFERGEPLDRFIASVALRPALGRRVAETGVDAYLKMILVDNFVHSDLHPGNILVDDGLDPASGKRVSEPQLVILDAGLVTELSETDRGNFEALMRAVVQGNGRHAANLMSANQPHLSAQTREEFAEGLDRVVRYVSEHDIADVNIGVVFSEILSLGRKHHVIIESNFTTLVVGSMVLEGVGRQLYPKLNIIRQAEPFVLRSPRLLMEYLQASLNKKLFQ